MEIVPMTLSACSRIEQIGKQCLPIYYKINQLLYLYMSSKYQLRMIQNSNTHTIVGFIIYEWLKSTQPETIQICSLAIIPESRKQGYAQQLLYDLIHNYPKATLCLHVLEDNHNAIQLYKKMGFHQKRLVPNYYETLQKNAYFFERIK